MDDCQKKYERLQLLFKNAPSTLIGIDPNGSLTDWNIKAEIAFGRKESEVVGKSFLQMLVAPSSQESVENLFRETVTSVTEASKPIQINALKKDGSTFPIELVLIPIRTKDDFTIYARFLDVTEAKKQEADLKKASKFLNAIVENIPDMIFIKEAKELRFTRFNKAGEELLGYSQADLIGKNDYDFFPQKEADFFTSIDRNVLDHKRLVEIPEEPIQTRYKGQRLLHTKKVPIYDENGQPEFLLGISEDITEKKQAEKTQRKLWQEQEARKEAEKALQLRDEFISIAAHELRTPLTTLSLQIQLLNKFAPHLDTAHMAKFSSMMASSQDQLNRFEKLVEDLLDVSRASAGMLIVEKTKENLSDIVAQVTKSLEARLTKANCQLKLTLDSSVIGSWDKIRIEQLVINLLSNAIKYGPGKPIEIIAKTENDKAILVMRDQGIGIAKEDQERIFNRFERAVSVKKYGGLGLGLYISQQIVTAHGGQIHVQSEIGKGTTFTVELPLS